MVIADVSGKGVAAGLLMPSIEVALRMDATRSQASGGWKEETNNKKAKVETGFGRK